MYVCNVKNLYKQHVILLSANKFSWFNYFLCNMIHLIVIFLVVKGKTDHQVLADASRMADFFLIYPNMKDSGNIQHLQRNVFVIMA